MPTRDTILVLTTPQDPTADAVIEHLRHLGTALVRWDTAAFPTEHTLSATFTYGTWSGGIRRDDRMFVDLERIRSVLYWRPGRFQLPAGMSPADQVMAAAEARHAIGGLLAALPAEVLWVNDPLHTAAAEYKPLQLEVAARCGLPVPRTVLSNDATDVTRLADLVAGPVVCKPLTGLTFTQDGHQISKTYTTVIDAAAIDPAAFRATAHLVQEYLGKELEARVTVVGERVFTVAIHAGSETARIDWRADYDRLYYEHIPTPDDIADAVCRYLKELGLAFGAFDFAITPGGEWVLLECNPAGQWLWLEEATGLPIAAAVAELLAGSGGGL